MEGEKTMTKFGDDLITALGQALAHARGDDSVVGAVHEIDRAREAVDVKAVRRRVGLKQVEMARIMDMSLSGYRKWEQNTRSVSGPARTMLVVMEREPEAVIRALAPEMAELHNTLDARAGGGTTAKGTKPTSRKAQGRAKSSVNRRRQEVA